MAKIDLGYVKRQKSEKLGIAVILNTFAKLKFLLVCVSSVLIACSNEPILLPNDVNLTPLFDIPLPPYIEDLSAVMDTSKLGDHHRFDHTNSLREEGEWMEEWQYSIFNETSGQSSTVQVTLILDSTVADSKAFFPGGCFVEEVYQSELSANTKYVDQVFISYLEESRAGPEGWYTPLGYYTSCVVIRRGNLIIEFDERTEFEDRDQIDAVIQELSELFYTESNQFH